MKGILNRTLVLVGLIWLSVAMAGHGATIRTWIGEGTDDEASTPQNWSGGTAPVTGDHIRFDGSHLGNAWTNATWNLEIEPASWTQTVAYAGTVTIETRYPGQGSSFTNLTITGDVTLEGGTWTHPQNTGGHDQVDRLAVTIQGDLTLRAPAAINVAGQGHAPGTGPARGSSSNSHGHQGASHGGLSGPPASPNEYYRTYGSIRKPIHLGSAAQQRGGGAVRLRVGGETLFDGGTINANAVGGLSGSAGGSVWLTTGSLAGTGSIQANGSGGSSTGSNNGGGGGRIAVVLTNGTSFASVTMQAFSLTGAQHRGAAGTVYRESTEHAPGAGILTIDNNNNYGWSERAPRGLATTLMTPEENDLSTFSEIIISNKGILGLNTNTVWDLGNAVNLTGFGADQSYVAAPYTNHLALPADWTLADYELLLFDSVAFDSLTASNGGLRLMDANAEPGLSVSGDLHIGDGGIISGHRVTVGNDLTIDDGGALTHQPFDEDFRLILTVGNDLVIHDGGRLHADAAGFFRSEGPGAGIGSNHNNRPAASHGGLGTYNPGDVSPTYFTYGSIFQPVRFGSSGRAIGGGAIQATVTGTTVLNGEITARPVGGQADGSGGSIWLTTGKLEGDGAIAAMTTRYQTGGTQQNAGGGGRIAIYVAESGLDEVDLRASGGRAINRRSAAGTIYTQTAGVLPGWGTILIDNDRAVQSGEDITTPLPPDTEWPAEDFTTAKLVLDNKARVSLNSSLTMRDLFILHPDARLHLNGHTLRLRMPYHADWGSEENVIYDGGEIIWTPRGTMITIR